MSITVTNATSGGGSISSSSSFTTGNFNFVAGDLYIVSVVDSIGVANSTSLSSVAGITWTSQVNFKYDTSNAYYLTVFTGVATSSVFSNVTVTTPTFSGQVSVVVDQAASVNSSGTIVQTNHTSNNGASSVSTTLASGLTSGDISYSTGVSTSSTLTPISSYGMTSVFGSTKLNTNITGYMATATGNQVTSGYTTFSSGTTYNGVWACEIKASAGGGTLNVCIVDCGGN